MSEAQDTFISHLVELRDRLMRALIAVGVVFVCLMPWAGARAATTSPPTPGTASSAASTRP